MRPLRNATAAPHAAGIAITGVELQDLRWGREGPGYIAAKRGPQRGAQEVAEAHVSGQEAIAMIRFELIGEAGQFLSFAPAVRTSSGVGDGNYLLRVTVPGQPFRFHINGRDVSGKPFSRLDRKLFRPGDEF